MAALARLAAVLIILLIPTVVAAQDLCRGREDCRQGDPSALGRDADLQPLRVWLVTLPTPYDPYGAELCSSGLEEVWLQRSVDAPAMIATACASVGIASGIAITLGDNRLTASFAGPGGQSVYDTVYSLSPLRIERQQLCVAVFGDHPRFIQTTLNAQTLQGEAVASIAAPWSPTRESTPLGCDPRRASQHWLVIPRLEIDLVAMRSALASLGDCSAAMDAQGGYVLAGRRGGAEIRLLATGLGSLLIQVVDTDPAMTGAAAPPLARRSHLEVWASDTAHPVADPAAEARVSAGMIDLDTGAWSPIAAAGAGSALPRPLVATWTAQLADGRAARLYHLTYASAGDAAISFTVVYQRFSRGFQTLRLASSPARPRQASSLGETFDVSAFTRCEVRGGALSLTGAGVVHVPFEASEAGGLNRPR